MNQRSSMLQRSIIIPLRFVMFIWLVFFIGIYFQINLAVLGIFPRDLLGLLGIFTAPLIHGDIIHLVSNTFPLLFLGTALFLFYDRIAFKVIYQCYFLPGIMVWLFARPSIHIGASGLIYGLAFFFIFFGLFRKDIKSIFLATVVVLLYGGLFYGVLPNQPGISWESHLLGGMVGASSASYYSAVKKVSS